MITVVNKISHTPTPFDVYIGRPTILGNPFSHVVSTYDIILVKTREEAVEYYRKWLLDNLQVLESSLRSLAQRHEQEGHLNLVCWCAPKACHGDVIKEYLTSPMYMREYVPE